MRALLLFFLASPGSFPAGAAEVARVIPPDCRQLVLVVTPGWAAARGELQRYQRSTAETRWQKIGEPCEVLLGEQGLTWGVGLFAPPAVAERRKREGDRCSCPTARSARVLRR